jgi:serine/threonine protein kinase
MDFYPSTLSEYSRERIASLLTKLKLLYEAALGLKWLQERGVCHRDIKPQNIMIDLNQKVKIIDFGSCIQNYESSQLGQGGFKTHEEKCTFCVK